MVEYALRYIYISLVFQYFPKMLYKGIIYAVWSDVYIRGGTINRYIAILLQAIRESIFCDKYRYFN